MNTLTAASKLMKDAYKAAAMKHAAGLGEISELYDLELAGAKRILFEETIPLALDITAEIKRQQSERKIDVVGYMVTVRPKDCTWAYFFELTKGFTLRKPFINWELAFEQKGPALGDGFHFHMIITKWQSTLRSKAGLLDWASSTFQKCCARNCIKVDTLRGAEDLAKVRAYIYEHKSEDGHKELTAQSDAEWRLREGLRDVYTHDNGLSSTSAIVPSFQLAF